MYFDLIYNSLWLFAIASIIFWVVSPNHILVKTIYWLIFNIFILFSLLYIVANYFSGRGVEESVWFHVAYAIDWDVVKQFKWIVASVTLTFLVSVYGTFYMFVKANIFDSFFDRQEIMSSTFRAALLGICFLLYGTAFIFHPLVMQTHALAQRLMPGHRLDMNDYLKPAYISKKDPKSFIWIYAESLEKEFLNQNRFPKLMPRLTKEINDRGLIINGIQQLSLTSWTIAGMTASQCGMPLSPISIADKNAFKKTTGSYVIGNECIGDILSLDGYRLYYFGGADLEFAAKGSFYREHGFSDVLGLKELEAMSRPTGVPTSKWGVYDDYLYKKAFEHIDAALRKKEKFGVVALTLDTHGPSGFASPSCRPSDKYKHNKEESGMLDAVSCTDRLLTNFISDVLSHPALDDTLVILSSDHLMPGNDAGLKPNTDRENLFVVWNSQQTSERQLTTQATMLDIAPTFLSLIGYETRHFGLGVNLFSDEPTLVKVLGTAQLEKQSIAWKNQMYALMRKANENK